MIPCMIRLFVAGVLIATAALRIHGLIDGLTAKTGVFGTSEIQLAAVELEIGVAIWLLATLSIAPLGPWLASVLLFSLFAVVSFYLGWMGESSCGCAGSLVRLNPWYAFSFDLMVICALMVIRPRLVREHGRDRLISAGRSTLAGLGGVAVFSTLLLLTANAVFGRSTVQLSTSGPNEFPFPRA